MTGPYKQDQNLLVSGPGLPEPGCVAVGADELNAAFMAGWEKGCEDSCGDYGYWDPPKKPKKL